MKKGKLNMVIGLQWGSESKGKLAHYLAVHDKVDVAVCNFGPNAGHTIVGDDGESKVFKMLPVSTSVPGVRILLGPGSVIDVPRFLSEVERENAWGRVKVHPFATVICPENIEYERESLGRIASTLQGTGAARGMKVMRHPNTKMAKDVAVMVDFMADTVDLLHGYLDAGLSCMYEGAQGFDLSLNHGTRYPYVTSRDCDTSSLAGELGVPPSMVGDVYGCLRTYPIRVGHLMVGDHKVGDSGPCYPDQKETTWEAVRFKSGSAVSLEEKTTVTKRVRRVFTFSFRQLRRAMRRCAPTHLFVNFVNHLHVGDREKRTWAELSQETKHFIKDLYRFIDEEETDATRARCRVSHLGTGPRLSDMVEIEG